jgi:hypothetical protein
MWQHVLVSNFRWWEKKILDEKMKVECYHVRRLSCSEMANPSYQVGTNTCGNFCVMIAQSCMMAHFLRNALPYNKHATRC